MAKETFLQKGALVILGVMATGLLSFCTWIVIDASELHAKDREHDLKLKFSNDTIQEMRKDIKDIKKHLLGHE